MAGAYVGARGISHAYLLIGSGRMLNYGIKAVSATVVFASRWGAIYLSRSVLTRLARQAVPYALTTADLAGSAYAVQYIARDVCGMTSPAEQDAAAFLANAYLSGLWIRADQQFARGLQEPDSVWSLYPFERGRVIEGNLGHNLPDNYPTIDRFHSGRATSIKSLDLHAASYQNTRTLDRVVTQYIDDVAGFQGRRWAQVNIRASQIVERELLLAVPPGGTPDQLRILESLASYADQLGVTLRIVIIP